jgi:hypothetical protein
MRVQASLSDSCMLFVSRNAVGCYWGRRSYGSVVEKSTLT